MPRKTRAAVRSQEVQDASDIAASTPQPSTPLVHRVPLGEISDNKVAESVTVNTSEVHKEPATKTGKRKKGNGPKKSTRKKIAKAEESNIEVLEDCNRSATSSAVEEACQDLLMDNSRRFQRP